MRTLPLESSSFGAARPTRGRLAMLVVVILLGLSLSTPAFAQVRDSAARKLGRGTANLTLGVLAIPGHITQTTRERGPFVGATWGLTKGVFYTAATEIVGLFELMTFPFQTPPEFKPILSPEFPWQHFTGDPRPKPVSRQPSRRTTR